MVLLDQMTKWWELLLKATSHTPEPRSGDSLKCIEIDMPDLDPANISVVRLGRVLTIRGESMPLDILGDKYYEQFDLNSKVIVDNVLYFDPVLKIILVPGTAEQAFQSYKVSDLRPENDYGDPSNPSTTKQNL